jgi:hypothetical protein
MYDLINHFAKTVADTIPPEHVTDYERLLQNVGQVSTPDYQKRGFRVFIYLSPSPQFNVFFCFLLLCFFDFYFPKKIFCHL